VRRLLPGELAVLATHRSPGRDGGADAAKGWFTWDCRPSRTRRVTGPIDDLSNVCCSGQRKYAIDPQLPFAVLRTCPTARPQLNALRFHEAAVRDLLGPATSGHTIDREVATSMTGFKGRLPRGDGHLSGPYLQSSH